MLLITDSGSTKTEWCLLNNETKTYKILQTSGINPYYQDEQTIYRILENEFKEVISGSLKIFFYGAGCGNDKVTAIVVNPLIKYFKPLSLVVESDLMAAAHSLCMHHEGIACILGTGSNSCFYDGKKIIQHVPALGYILGDEGSGADIGRRLIADILKKQLPAPVINRFYETYSYTPDQIQEQVYKHPFPNRFLAQFTTFIAENLHEITLHNLVKSSFTKFFIRNIKQYPNAHEQPINFTGSIAYYFKDILNESAVENGFHLGIIVQSPIERLIQYHIENEYNLFNSKQK
jgi:glucosamine kinase